MSAPPSYAAARAAFLAAARDAGAELAGYDHPGAGPDGGALATDVARTGPADARFVLCVTSATHGVEGHCGSAVQTRFLRERRIEDVGDDFALVLVHAQNPHGFAWDRRVTEGNVDLNRNFVDFASPPTDNLEYETVHPWLVPDDWDGPAHARANAAIAAFVADRGFDAFQAAVGGGQWTHPDGLFYGGAGPTWSHRTVRTIAREHLARAEHVVVLDLHTGLGPRGHGELIYAREPRGPEHARLSSWYGADLTCVLDGTSASKPVFGTLDRGYREELGEERLSFLVIEYGTRPVPQVLNALRLDHFVHERGVVDTDLGRHAKERMRDTFFGAEPEWGEAVWDRAQAVAGVALRGLAGMR